MLPEGRRLCFPKCFFHSSFILSLHFNAHTEMVFPIPYQILKETEFSDLGLTWLLGYSHWLSSFQTGRYVLLNGGLFSYFVGFCLCVVWAPTKLYTTRLLCIDFLLKYSGGCMASFLQRNGSWNLNLHKSRSYFDKTKKKAHTF